LTTLVALLGDPVEHSRSPAMHNAAFRSMGLDWRYEAIGVGAERFGSLVRELRQRGYAGANVTIPHKLRALEAADVATEVAQAVGAANTLLFTEEGIFAHNTDVEGFLRALRERAPEAPAAMRALVLGGGGAARAVVYALAKEKAESVGVWNRHSERARALVEELGGHPETPPLEVVPEPGAVEADLLVNATSVGMRERGMGAEEDDFKQLHITADKFDDVRVVVDMVYRDNGTALVREASAHGSVCVDGFDVLAHQGAASFELWTAVKAPLQVMRREARKR
jgi:shikimate dehydrogenase